MKRTSTGSIACALIALFIGQAHLSYAALPAATFLEYLRYPVAQFFGEHVTDGFPEHVSSILVEDWRAVDAAAATWGGAQPKAEARMALTVNLGGTTWTGEAAGSLQYYWSVQQTGGEPFTDRIPVTISVKGFAQEVGATADAGSYVYASASFTEGLDQNWFLRAEPDDLGTASFDETIGVTVRVDRQHRVQLVAYGRGSIAGTGSFAFDAWVDPIITIDPAFARAGDFQIVFSEGIAAAIPEPETYTMLLAGSGLVGFMARRRRHCIARASSS